MLGLLFAGNLLNVYDRALPSVVLERIKGPHSDDWPTESRAQRSRAGGRAATSEGAPTVPPRPGHLDLGQL